jgi:hypothetical protein
MNLENEVHTEKLNPGSFRKWGKVCLAKWLEPNAGKLQLGFNP